MAKLPHYFTPYQTFVVAEGEKPEGKFDFRVGLEILQREAEYRAQLPTPQGLFLFQFETLCRNRLGYDRGLEAIAGDDNLRRQMAQLDPHRSPPDRSGRSGDMLYVRSEHYRQTRGESGKAVLFGEKEGRIALANRKKDPLYLFAALPALGLSDHSPHQARRQQPHVIPTLQRKIERLESRVKLLRKRCAAALI